MKVIFALAGQNRHVPRDTTNLTSQVNQVAEQCPFVYVGETGLIFMVTGNTLDHVEHVIKQIFVCSIQTYSWVLCARYKSYMHWPQSFPAVTELLLWQSVGILDLMKTKHFSQPTEVVLASGLEHCHIYITNYMSIKIDFSLFQGLLNPKWVLFQNRNISFSLSPS
jgi:hypothetical protein